MATNYKQNLIKYLLKHRTYVTGPELSTVLGVSTKTISRAVKTINTQSANSPLIESRRGRGYLLNYQNYLKEGNKTSQKVTSRNIPSVERRSNVLRKLLITSPEKHRLSDLFDRFYISDSVRSIDLRVLRQMLSEYKLQLHRQSEYVWIEGSEANIREAINDLLVTDDVTSIGYFLKTNQKNIQQQDASFVTRQMNLIEEEMGSEIPYPYSINLFSHLYVLIERYKHVGTMADENARLTANEEHQMRHHPTLVRICEQVIENLDKYLNFTLPKIEIFYVLQYVTSSRVDDMNDDWEKISDPVRSVTDFLIDKVSQDPDYRSINSTELFYRLARHIKPLLNRLENNIKVKNNLLGQIQLEYPHLFHTVKLACQQLSSRYQLSVIDDEEVGFITVYFAQAVENTRPAINIIIVCTTGLGTAQLLKAKINKHFSDLNIVELVAGRNLTDELHKHTEVDLIVSTISLPNIKTIPVLVVSAMFTMEDQERFEREINKVRKELNQ